MDDKQRKITLVSEETEDKFKEKFFPALYEFESKVLNSGNYDGEYGLHLRDTIRYQGINDFLMQPFSNENQAKLILKDQKLFVMIPEVKKVGEKELKTPLGQEMRKVFAEKGTDPRYANVVLEALVLHQDLINQKIDLYKEIQDFERILIRFRFLQFLAEIEKENAKLQKIFHNLSEDYAIERGVFRMNALVFFQVLRKTRLYQKEFDKIECEIALEELQKAADNFVRVTQQQETPVVVSKVEKEDFSHKILSFSKFKKSQNK